MNKKLTQTEHIARWVGMPCRLH